MTAMAHVDSDIAAVVADLYRTDRPAWDRVLAAMTLELDETVKALFRDSDPSRARVGQSRVKSLESFLDKAQRLMPADLAVTDLNPIEARQLVLDLVPDVLGIRIIVKTLRDTDLVTETLVRRYGSGSQITLVGEPTDYIARPKPSGYRSVHVYLSVPVPDPQPEDPDRVVVEVQLRTMMQDAWGELTHENSYKPGEHALPDLYLAIAKHMADMLHQVDELARTLAIETDALLDDLIRRETDDEQHNTLLDDAEYTGRVVSSGPNYALVVIGSRRGLLSAATLKEALGLSGYVHVHDFITAGDTIRVNVIEQDDAAGRLILAPADPESLRR
jgi:putative GTP pyrophosphokinase